MDERRGADEAHAALLGKFQKTTLRCKTLNSYPKIN